MGMVGRESGVRRDFFPFFPACRCQQQRRWQWRHGYGCICAVDAICSGFFTTVLPELVRQGIVTLAAASAAL